MKKLFFVLAIGLAAFAVGACAACQTTPVPPVAPDAGVVGDAPAPPSASDTGPALDDCQRGCAALALVGCVLGDAGTDCAGFLRTVNDARKEPNPANGNKPLTCADVAAVKTKADALKLNFCK